ncbi:alpha-ketoglutarate-dependent dioxygenase AlkB family protein [Chryseobacterium sp.]|uniref:alpha-ketoglutarate-dependent dioxygenase AlkB family protein n=1 Tax=Chryseobacterium sp. TaxID=1871047 RepID=UPI00388FE568
MSLFDENLEFPIQILPKDGEVNYYGKIFSLKESTSFYQYLLNQIPWENDESMIFGKLIITKRKVAWFGDENFEYTYSKRSKYALSWTQGLLELKNRCEEKIGETFNSCLLNLYHDGSEGMAYHSDDEKDLKKYGAIASLTFGAERKFLFKHKSTKEKVEILLENGSLLVMKGATQENWVHRLPPTTKSKAPRINLTFRTIVGKQVGVI